MQVQYSTGGLNTRLNLVGYSNDIWIQDHSATGQLLVIQTRLLPYSDPHLDEREGEREERTNVPLVTADIWTPYHYPLKIATQRSRKEKRKTIFF